MKSLSLKSLTNVKPLTNFNRSKQLTRVMNVIRGGYVKAYKIGAFDEPPRDILPRYIQVFCRKMTQAFGVEVICVAPIPQTHGLWACNHISWMDIPTVGSVSPVFFISKAEVAKYPIFGKLATACGTLFIRRGSGDAGSVSEQIARFMQQGSSVVFFPEATTTNGHRMKNIHGKLLQASMETGLPIQPLVICYVNENGEIDGDVPYYGGVTLKESFLQVLDAKKIRCYVLPLEALYPDNLSQNELTNKLHERMQTGLNKLQQQVLKNKPTDAAW